ncbi:MCM-domain-containing protein [Rozella allomycis CSF55]|uniref:DNA replication licensing factor MCM4 n=1 Tax=Rozella allomycis (strain CSF55) TaxID=988480 RepID=A0A4P9YIL7_ROZAC|nr:MCM-domain-containing protein [Rozella allomycis CSF55]
MQVEEEHPEGVRVIWGTDIQYNKVYNTFKSFFVGYKAVPGGEGVYVQMLRQIHETEIYHLSLDTNDLREWKETSELYEQLIAFPQEIIAIMDTVTNELYDRMYDSGENGGVIQVRPFNLEKVANMRQLDPNDIDNLVSVKGLVIRCSGIIPDMRQGYFQCCVCGFGMNVEINKGIISEPSKCPNDGCNSPDSMILVHNRCIFADKQIIRLQETPDEIPEGQTPHTVTLMVYDSLVDVVRPGDRIEITGMYRSAPVRVNPRMRTMKSIFRTYLDVLHIKKRLNNRMKLIQEEMTTSDYLTIHEEEMIQEKERVEEIVNEIKQIPNLYETLSESLAPSIWGLEDIKKGLLLQLFGGTSKLFQRNGNSRFRGDIHILLAGDPGVSKSQLLQYVHKLAPRGMYTSGKGSSAVGLTAYITRDPETNQVVLESGALVLSDGGICCIDEFDKMSDSTRAILHEAMEQQTVSIAKRGIIATLNARTSVLASANPVDSKYNTNKSIVENLNLPPTLLSRFDLIYLLLDNPSAETDRRLAHHLISLYTKDYNNITKGTIPINKLTTFISYARENVKPIISDDASDLLVESYVSMRKVNGSGKTVSATTRQLESLIRLSEAHAKARYLILTFLTRLSLSVDVEDVQEALRLVKNALLHYAIDPSTGRIDMDLITTGRSSASRDLLEKLRSAIISNLSSKQIKFDQLLSDLQAQSTIVIISLLFN